MLRGWDRESSVILGLALVAVVGLTVAVALMFLGPPVSVIMSHCPSPPPSGVTCM
jgi:hypothetical protein